MLEEGEQEAMQACLALSPLNLRLKDLVGSVTSVEKKKRAESMLSLSSFFSLLL